MDSSFLTVIHLMLGLYALVGAIKIFAQFGLPNHPAKFLAYVVTMSVLGYTVGQAATDLGLVFPLVWLRWQTLPVIIGALCLLFQVITTVANFSLIQQKVISRVPIIGALLCFTVFQAQASAFAAAFVGAGALFFIVSVGKARFMKRQYLKLALFLLLALAIRGGDLSWRLVLGETLLFPALFYFFIFEQAGLVAALIDDERRSSGDVA